MEFLPAMTDETTFPQPDPSTLTALREGDYEGAIAILEDQQNFAYLGIAHLLSGDEMAAQLVWMAPLMEGEDEAAWTDHLTQVLAQESLALGDPSLAWQLRQQLRQFNPDNLSNLLHLIQLSAQLHLWDDDALLEDTTLLLNSEASPPQDLLQQTCQILLSQNTSPPASEKFLKIALSNLPENFSLLLGMARFLQNRWDNLASLDYLRQAQAYVETPSQEILRSHLLLRGLLRSGGRWHQAQQAFEQHRQHLEQLISSETALSLELASQLITAGGMMAYLSDDLPGYRQLRNRIGHRCQAAIQQHLAQVTERYQSQFSRKSGDILKIGYLSECFRQHSVGWLVRWLLHYHDRQRFEIHLYSLSQTGDRLQQQFAQDTTLQFHPLPYSGLAAAEAIHRDKIDILVDLDSITSNAGCSTLALKPAPIQVSWLGCDAPGLPAVDYFLVDSHVLGPEAEQQYSEKLWRLPHSYIAVDGFEMGIPSLRRDRLGLPTDAVVYFCSQSGYKRNPEDTRRQLQILAQVPNSYLLIKGVYSDATSLQQQVQELAEAEGVDGDCGSRTLRDRLRFLPVTPSEEIHRANLTLADVVLDTYPYNGTTTTLEALWAGIPVVSRVGQQFASRQGYTLLNHAGVEAGIAFSDEDYLDWGVRLGQDVALRRQVSAQLLRNRRTAPLWNARQFTREVEQMYQSIVNR
jgi:predicted O-linked N-acetylglucosamine transferase (SPINDLY family)